MKINKILIFCLLLSSFFSCKKTNIDEQVNANIFGFNSMQEAEDNLGVYAKIFQNTDASIEIRSTFYNNIEKRVNSISGRFVDAETRTFRNDIDEISINNISLKFNNTSKRYTADNVPNLFGEDLKFYLKDKNGEINQSMYMPDELDVKVALDLFPYSNISSLSKNDDLIVKWNKDNNNSNGLVAYLHWDGSTTDNPGISTKLEKEIHRAMKFDDDGTEILPKSFFDGLPVNANFIIYFIRGNIDIYELGDMKVKLYSMLN